MTKAQAYRIAAEWHDERAQDAEQMMDNFKRGTTSYVQARTSAQNHRNAARGLRYAADQLDGANWS